MSSQLGKIPLKFKDFLKKESYSCADSFQFVVYNKMRESDTLDIDYYYLCEKFIDSNNLFFRLKISGKEFVEQFKKIHTHPRVLLYNPETYLEIIRWKLDNTPGLEKTLETITTSSIFGI